jgi:hypothetical protein
VLAGIPLAAVRHSRGSWKWKERGSWWFDLSFP